MKGGGSPIWRGLPPVVALLALAAVTELPYANGRRSAPPGYHYDGLVAHSEDIHAYLSFARQAAGGRLLFENLYAPSSHRPVFFNLEWLLVGRAMRWLGDPLVLTAWRVTGIALLVFGFWSLSRLLSRYEDRLVALSLFCLGGGLGWVAEVARVLISPDRSAGSASAPFQMDQGGWGLHPFVQMLQNPHFTVPHGLVLLALAFLVAGERTGRTSCYALAGVMALTATLARPYELLAFTITLPVVHLISGAILDARRAAQRALVLLIAAPAWLPVLAIWREAAFRPLAQQGVMPLVSPPAHLIGLGVCVALVAVRVVRGPQLSLRTPQERPLLVWSAAILLLVHANRFSTALAFSPQLMTTSMGPLVLLAVPGIAGVFARSGAWRPFGVAVVLGLALPSTAIVLVKRYRDAATPYYHFSEGEREAWDWLARRARSSDLILAAAETGNRIPRRVLAHVFAGHWTLTPDYDRRRLEAREFFEGRLSSEGASSLLRQWGVDWVWVGPREKRMGGWAAAGFAPGCDQVYRRRGVRILRCSPPAVPSRVSVTNVYGCDSARSAWSSSRSASCLGLETWAGISRSAFSMARAPAACRRRPSAVSSARTLRRSCGSSARETSPSASRRSTSC